MPKIIRYSSFNDNVYMAEESDRVSLIMRINACMIY